MAVPHAINVLCAARTRCDAGDSRTTTELTLTSSTNGPKRAFPPLTTRMFASSTNRSSAPSLRLQIVHSLAPPAFAGLGAGHLHRADGHYHLNCARRYVRCTSVHCDSSIHRSQYQADAFITDTQKTFLMRQPEGGSQSTRACTGANRLQRSSGACRQRASMSCLPRHER